MELDPPERGGVQYVIAEVLSDMRPSMEYKFAHRTFQIQKTYCFECRKVGSGVRWFNRVFSDSFVFSCGPSLAHHWVEQNVVADRSWRRGYFKCRTWDRAIPKKGSTTTLMRRHEEQHGHADSSSDEDDFSRRTRKYVRKLTRRRLAAKRVAGATATRISSLQAANADAEGSSDSSSSASAECSGGSSLSFDGVS
jgi:hypothetical protein